jgi:hypothetical protein
MTCVQGACRLTMAPPDFVAYSGLQGIAIFRKLSTKSGEPILLVATTVLRTSTRTCSHPEAMPDGCSADWRGMTTALEPS